MSYIGDSYFPHRQNENIYYSQPYNVGRFPAQRLPPITRSDSFYGNTYGLQKSVIPSITQQRGSIYPSRSNRIGPENYIETKGFSKCQKLLILFVVLTVIVVVAGCGVAAWLYLSGEDGDDDHGDDHNARPRYMITTVTYGHTTEDEIDITQQTHNDKSSKAVTQKPASAVTTIMPPLSRTTKPKPTTSTTATTTMKSTTTKPSTSVKPTTTVSTTSKATTTTTMIKQTTTPTATTKKLTTTTKLATTIKPTTTSTTTTTTTKPTTTVTTSSSTTTTTTKPTTMTTVEPTTTIKPTTTTIKPTTTTTTTTKPTIMTTVEPTTTTKPTTTTIKPTTTTTTTTTTNKQITTAMPTTSTKPTTTTTTTKPTTTMRQTTTTPVTDNTTTLQTPFITNSTLSNLSTTTKATTTTPSGNCASNQFQCTDGACITLQNRCDGFTDCRDWSDETSCNCASLGKFQCDNKLCISTSWRCDQANDCKDNSDERNCPCTTGFECLSDNVCLPISKRCDHFEDCQDGSDEHNCTCHSREQACPNGPCILKEWFCDGSVDCPGGEDEHNCSSCASSEFSCANHEKCIPSAKRCDMSTDCSDGSDEKDCINIVVQYNALAVVLENLQRVSVCSTGWDHAWNEFVCNATGSGTFVNSTTISSSMVSHSANGYALPKVGTPLQNLHEVLYPTISTNCPSSEVICITCSFDACGTRIRHVEPDLSPAKIVQGYTAQPGSWPWQVALYLDTTMTCGATVISPEWVITAAHCIERAENSPERFSVKVGTTVHSDQGVSTQQTAKVKALCMHDGYNDRTLENDIALVRLDSTLEITDYVRPACLPKSANESSEDPIECYISGWGGIDTTASRYPDSLQEAKMHLIDDSTCEINPDIKRYGLYNETMLCAGYSHGHITVCKGDSGGPLVCRGKNNIWSLYGVTSWGPVTATVKCMGISVFAEVSTYLEWIYRMSGVS